MDRLRPWLPSILFVVVCVPLGLWCSGTLMSPRYTHGFGKFDLGEGRLVRIWYQSVMGDPPMICYEVVRNGVPLDRVRCAGLVRHPHYDVRTVWTPDCSTSCTFAVVGSERAFAIYCDWPSGEVWPHSESQGDYDRWGERYRRLRTANPDMPADPQFEPG